MKIENVTLDGLKSRRVTVLEHSEVVLFAFNKLAGLKRVAINAMTKFSEYSWALTHPQRQNFIFQLHRGKNVRLIISEFFDFL